MVRYGYNCGYTSSMKTAVSMPDDLFLRADATARRLKLSRSALYAKAISAYLNQQDQDDITRRLNEVYSRTSSKLDPQLARTQTKLLKKVDW